MVGSSARGLVCSAKLKAHFQFRSCWINLQIVLLKKQGDGGSLMLLMLNSYLSIICTILNSNITPQKKNPSFLYSAHWLLLQISAEENSCNEKKRAISLKTKLSRNHLFLNHSYLFGVKCHISSKTLGQFFMKAKRKIYSCLMFSGYNPACGCIYYLDMSLCLPYWKRKSR